MKKRMKKRMLSALLALCMVLTMVPAAFAADNGTEENTSSSGSVSTTLPAAVDGVYTLDKDVTLNTALTIEEDENIVLDLNGYTLTLPQILVKGELIIQDSQTDGTIDAESKIEVEGGSLTLNGGTIRNDEADSDNSGYGIYVSENGTVIVNDGTIESLDSALAGNNTTGDMNFEVNGGTLTAKQGPAIYMPGQAFLSITGGTLNGGVSLRMGQVKISGGTINATTGPIDSIANYYNYSGNAWLADALYVFNGTYTSDNATYGNSLNLNITGGTFNCTNSQGSAVAIYDLGKVEQASKVTISGDAKLSNTTKTRSAYQVLSLSDIGVNIPAEGYGNYADEVNSLITGGTFSNSVAAYVADDIMYEAVVNDTYTYHKDLASAMNAIADVEDGVINVIKDNAVVGEEGRYTVIFDYNYEGAPVNTVYVLNDDTVSIVLPDAERSGYTLDGWMDSITSTVYEVGDDVAIRSDVTFTAQWDRNSSSSSGGGGGGSSTYSVTVPSVENGTVTVSPRNASRGATVTITVTPDEGYELDTLTVTDANGNRITLTNADDGKYTFTMPSSRVTVNATFTEVGSEPEQVGSFTDVNTDNWFADAVQYMLDNGMMNGTSSTTFSPNAATTRGMIVTILYRLEGEPAATTSNFSDVASNAYYADAVAWAAANNIVNGYGDNRFGPNDNITREQMAAILYRYAQFKGYDVTASNNLSGYTDASQISAYATTAMQWANAEELITGVTSTVIDPQGNATRAQVATILMRFCENIAG